MGSDDLVQEPVGRQAQSEQRDPQHHPPSQGDLVLARRIIDRMQRPGVVTAVDLDHQLDVPRLDVQVDPRTGTDAHRLACRLGSASSATP